MANKKISELQSRTPSLTDLLLVGDPSSGYSYKCTVSALATIIETDIADGYVTIGTTQTISGAKTFSNNLALTSVSNANTDTDKFLVLNASNVVNFRTGAEVLSDIGGQGALTLTTTGTSGAATLVSNVLNIPQYQGVISLASIGSSPNANGATLSSNTLTLQPASGSFGGVVTTGFQEFAGQKRFIGNPIQFDKHLEVKNIDSWGVSWGYTSLASKDTPVFGFLRGHSFVGTVTYYAWFTYGSTGERNYTLPSTDGTLALTSDITSSISGTPNYIPKFTGSSSIGNSVIYESSSNIGIGTTAPSARLHILANNALNEGVAASIIRQGGSAGNNGLLVDVTNTVGQYVADFRIANSSVMRLDASGNLGLGVTPSAWGSGYIAQQIGTRTALISGTLGQTFIGNNNYNNGTNWLYLQTAATSLYEQYAGSHAWYNAPSGTAGNAISFTQAMTLDASGRLGIGTTSPLTLLNPQANNNDANTGQLVISGATSSAKRTSIGYNTTSDYGFISVYTALVGYNPLALQPNGGNVLVGTTTTAMNNQNGVVITPTSLGAYSNSGNGLLIAGAMRGTVAANIGGQINFQAIYRNSDDDYTDIAYIKGLRENATDNNWSSYISFETTSSTTTSERMRITSAGDVFIGNTAAVNADKLGITYSSELRLGIVLNDTYTGAASGQIAIQFRRNGSAVGDITTTTTSTAYNTSSDYRLKQDLKDFNGLSLVNQINVYDYQWKSDNTRSYGVMAHELQSVLPYAVTGVKDGEKMQGVDYSKIVPILIKSIKELKAEIETLKNK
jgi:hypothetical protein